MFLWYKIVPKLYRNLAQLTIKKSDRSEYIEKETLIELALTFN